MCVHVTASSSTPSLPLPQMDSKTLAALGVVLNQNILDVTQAQDELQAWRLATPMDLHMVASVQDQARVHREAGYGGLDIFLRRLSDYYHMPPYNKNNVPNLERVAKILASRGYDVRVWNDAYVKCYCCDCVMSIDWGSSRESKDLRWTLFPSTGPLEPKTDLRQFKEFEDQMTDDEDDEDDE